MKSLCSQSSTLGGEEAGQRKTKRKRVWCWWGEKNNQLPTDMVLSPKKCCLQNI